MNPGSVGVVGLGNIGQGVAATYVNRSPFRVMVWDIDQSVRERFARAHDVEIAPPNKMAEVVDAMIFLVPSTVEIRECLEGPDGALQAERDGLVIFDLTTSDPEETRALARRVGTRGIQYFDAGTSGGPYKAERGELLLMVGGDEAAYERSREYIQPICEHLFFVGPSGAGHTLKLLHNIVCHTTTLVTAEAGHMAERANISLADMIDVFNVSNARSYATEFRFPRHIVSRTWDGRSRIYNLHKDIAMGVRMGKALGADTTFASATLGILQKAIARGMENDDYTLLYRDFDKIRKAD